MGRLFGRHEKGYTIVEVLVVMLIMALISTGLYTSFEAGLKHFNIQQGAISMQQRARGAIMALEKDLKNAGYGFWDAGNLVINYYNPATSNKDNWSVVTAFDNTSSATIARRTDSVSIRYMNGPTDAAANTVIAQSHPDASAVTYVNSTAGFNLGDMFLIYDPTDWSKPASLLQVSNDPKDVASPKDKLLHNSGGPIARYNPPNPAKNIFPPGGYKAGSRIINFSTSGQTTYYIDANRNLVKSVLTSPVSTPVTRPIASGIEDLQIKYGFKDGQWLDAPIAGDASHDVNNLRAFRVSLVVRSDKSDPNFTSASVFQLSGANGNGLAYSGGGYRRMVVSTTISLRNMGIRGN